MRVLYIHQYFCLPTEPGGTRSYWISKELVNRGHQVTMICSTNKAHPLPCETDIDGIHIIYVKNDYSNYMSAPRKVWSFISFLMKSIRTGCKQKDVDIVFATSTPLTIGYVALRIKAKKQWKYVFEVRDLWPEFPIQVGAIKNPLIISILRRFEKRIYDNSEHIVALSPGMKEGIINSGTPESKVSMIPNMSKPDIFYPHAPSQKIAKQFSIDLGKFNVIHFGSMGRANGLQYIIEAARCLKEKGDFSVNFIFMGSGATEPIIKKKAEDYSLSNVQFLGSHKMDIVSEVVNCCDASITTFLNLPILKTNSPNKLFDSLSAGKPIIVNSAGWTKDMVEKDDCGFYVDPEKPEMLAEKLLEIKDNILLLQRWGANARRLSLEVFDKEMLSAKVADVLEEFGKK